MGMEYQRREARGREEKELDLLKSRNHSLSLLGGRGGSGRLLLGRIIVESFDKSTRVRLTLSASLLFFI